LEALVHWRFKVSELEGYGWAGWAKATGITGY
jgi:hypothetical protein